MSTLIPEDDDAVAWMQVDDQLHSHRKFLKLGRDRMAVTGLWTTAGSWVAAHLTDGWIPDYVVEQWDPGLTMAARLVEVELWHREQVGGEDGFVFHDWVIINRSREEIEKSREDARARQRRSRERRRQGDGTFGPDPGPGGGQLPLDDGCDDRVTESTSSRVTNGRVTRDSRVSSASVTPLPPHPTPPKEETCSTTSSDSSRQATNDEPDGFAEWYAEFPRKVGRRAAAKAYRSARTRASSSELMTGARTYARSRRGQDPRFTVHPSTWLNQDRWKDEVTARAVARDPRTGRAVDFG